MESTSKPPYCDPPILMAKVDSLQPPHHPKKAVYGIARPQYLVTALILELATITLSGLRLYRHRWNHNLCISLVVRSLTRWI